MSSEVFNETEIGMIPEDWKITTLADLINIKHGFAFKGQYFTEEKGPNILLTPGNFKIGGGFNDSKFKYYTGEIPNNYVLKENDIVVTMTDLSKDGDTLGYPAKIPPSNGIKFLHNQRLGLIEFKAGKIDSEFLYWKLRNYDYRHWVLATSTGTTVRHTSPSRILQFKFALPDIKEQIRIAKILSDLDSKIKLNQKMNQILEEIGKATFRHWFIDLEFPDNEGKPYKSNSGEMVDSELGEIPKIWKIKPIEKCYCDVKRGFTTKYVKKSSLINLNQKVNRGEYLDKSNYKYYPKDTVVPEDKYARRKDLLINSLGQGTLGRVHLFWENSRNIVVDQHITILRPDQEFITSEYLYFYLIRPENQYRLENEITGSTGMLMLNISKIREFPVIIPDIDIQRKFSSLISKLYSKKLINVNESENLAKIRDSLLPRLMSGKIRVKEGLDLDQPSSISIEALE